MGSFTAIPTGAMNGLDSSEQIVLFWIFFHYNRRTKKCCPGIRLLAEEAHLHKETVQKAIKGLVEKHRIRRKWAGRGNTCFYEILEVPRSGRKGGTQWAERGNGGGRKGGTEPDEVNQMKLTREQLIKKMEMEPNRKVQEENVILETTPFD